MRSNKFTYFHWECTNVHIFIHKKTHPYKSKLTSIYTNVILKKNTKDLESSSFSIFTIILQPIVLFFTRTSTSSTMCHSPGSPKTLRQSCYIRLPPSYRASRGTPYSPGSSLFVVQQKTLALTFALDRWRKKSWRYLKAVNSLSRAVKNCFIWPNLMCISTFWGSTNGSHLVPPRSEISPLWPVLPLVLHLGVPSFPKTKIAEKLAKTSLASHQECHHFEVFDDFLPYPSYFKECSNVLILL